MGRGAIGLGRGIGAAALVLGGAGAVGGAGVWAAPDAGATTMATLFASPTGSGTTCTSTTPCTVAKASEKAITDHHDAVTIHLASGTYHHVNVYLDSATLASLSVVGAGTSGTGASVLDGTGAAPIVVAEGTPPKTFSSLAITDAHSVTTGGCVQVLGPLTVTHAAVTDCKAEIGGGFYVATTTLHLSTSTVSHDTATKTGAGIYVAAGGTVGLSADTFATDTATDSGGGVADKGTLHVTGTAFDGDKAATGASIYSSHTTLLVTVAIHASTFTTDAATGTAGGVDAYTTTLTVTGSTFSKDTGHNGGAIDLYRGTSTLSGDTFSHDSTTADWGGGVDNFGATLAVTGSTFVSDAAAEYGGGLVTENTDSVVKTIGHSTVTNDTFITDSAATGGAVAVEGASTTTMVDDTLSHNAASTHGPGVYVTGTSTLTTANSIFWASSCYIKSGGTYTDLGHNVASTHTCTTAATDVSTSATIGLGPLAANTSAGPQTLAVTPTSSAFEVVPAAACTVNVTERGFSRPGAPTKNCDAGAYEYQLTGYDLVGSDGGVFVFNPPGVHTKGFYGSLPGIHVVPNAPVVGIVPTVSDQGYFLVGADGGVYAFGNAPFLGSLPGIKVTPNLPIVGIVAANTDKGYFLVGQDGGVYAFGTVPFLGSLPGKGISVSNVIGIAATPSGNGYWVVQATGTVHAFGTAQAFTTTATTSAVTAIAGTPTGGGYWLVTQKGGVYPYGNAHKEGSGTLPAIHVTPNLAVIGIVRVADTVGYWLIGKDGGVFAFGTAPFVGSLPGNTPPVSVTDIVGAVPN